MKQIKIQIDFLGVDVTVIPCKQGEIALERSKLRRRYPNLPVMRLEGELAGLHTCLYEEYPYQHWIFLEKKTEVGIIVHEAQHCVDDICDYFDLEDKEFRAYLMEYIVEKIIGRRSFVFK